MFSKTSLHNCTVAQCSDWEAQNQSRDPWTQYLAVVMSWKKHLSSLRFIILLLPFIHQMQLAVTLGSETNFVGTMTYCRTSAIVKIARTLHWLIDLFGQYACSPALPMIHLQHYYCSRLDFRLGHYKVLWDLPLLSKIRLEQFGTVVQVLIGLPWIIAPNAATHVWTCVDVGPCSNSTRSEEGSIEFVSTYRLAKLTGYLKLLLSQWSSFAAFFRIFRKSRLNLLTGYHFAFWELQEVPCIVWSCLLYMLRMLVLTYLHHRLALRVLLCLFPCWMRLHLLYFVTAT